MYTDEKIWLASDGEERLCILPKMANRHGLIAGATGTGKTITLKVLAESFSDAGVPVLLADVKGDIAGMCRPGEPSENMDRRIERFGLAAAGYGFKAYPTEFWDIFGQKGLPLRTTVSEFGPLLLAKLLGLNQIQSDLLNITFKIADDEGLLLIDIKDLKSMLNYIMDNSENYRAEYGNIAKQSIGAIMRALVSLEDRGGEKYFGEPALDINDWFRNDAEGRGYINILDSSSLINDTSAYAAFMLWLLSELFETMPEVGDPEKPKLVFFFDEAHLLFKDTPKALLDKIEQVVKLIRSKGIGVFFITQNPSDIPDGVLAQLGNKVQHALRAYTPSEQKAVRAAAMSYRVNPEFDTEEAITALGTGEAVVSFITEDGSPSVVRKAGILPPSSLMGPIDDITRQAAILVSKLKDKYSEGIDRDSAYEFLNRMSIENQQRLEAELREAEEKKEAEKLAEAERKEAERLEAAERKEAEKLAAAEERARIKEEEARKKAEEREAAAEKKRTARAVGSVAGSAAGTIGREIGNTFGKSIGGSFGKRIGGNVGASLGRGILKTLFKL